MQTRKARIAILFAALVVAVPGCKGVGRFDTGPKGAYCGELTNGSTTDALIPDSGGEQAKLKLSLTLDIHQLGSGSTILGTGEVALILDVAALLQQAVGQPAHHARRGEAALSTANIV